MLGVGAFFCRSPILNVLHIRTNGVEGGPIIRVKGGNEV